MSLNRAISQIETPEIPEVPYPSRRCFNIYSAAQYCSCKCAAIEQAIHDGELRAIRLGRGYVITRESLDSFIDAREAVEPHVPPSILARRAARAVNAPPAQSSKQRRVVS
jgi:excisionase family DNA binding protein